MRSYSVFAALVAIAGMAPVSSFADELRPYGITAPKVKWIEIQPTAGASPLLLVRTPEPLPADAQSLVTVFDAESVAIRQKAEQEIQTKRQALITALQALQDSYTRAAKLDEAVAIRDVIRQLKVSQVKPLPNPGNLAAYVNRIGETFYFDVTGEIGSSIWGSEVYTYDSYLATAAVHAGILKQGQRGIVKVTMVKSPEAHRGSTQNGVSSSNWGPYGASYTVENAFSDRTPPLATTPVAPQPVLTPRE